METASLQFLGVRSFALLLGVGAIVALVLVGWGVYQLLQRRVRYAVASVPAAPAALLAAKSAGPGAWMALLGVQLALAVAVFYRAVYAYLGKARLAALMVLRCLAVGTLLLVLFKPAISCTPGAADARIRLPVLVDRSASMSVTDDPSTPSRYQQAVQMLQSQQSRIERKFTPVYYHFGESLRAAGSLEELSELAPRGEGSDGTNIALALRAAADDFSRDRIPGVLLITDGAHNAPDRVVDAAVESGVPVYAAAVGSKGRAAAGRPNIRIVAADAPLEVVKNNTASLTVQAKVTGIASPAPAQLLEGASDTPVETATFRKVGGSLWEAQLRWTPRDAPGGGDDVVRVLRIAVPADRDETVADDNRTELHVLVAQPRIRVLYVEGSMRPEYKFLRRLLDSDPNVQLQALVRVSGNRFWAQGSLGGQTLDRLPTEAEDFRLFDVLILGDLDSTFLGDARLARIRQFVNDGGGLLMLGGHNSLGPGGYGQTVLEEVLPVEVGTRNQGQEATPFVPQLTADGESHPIFEGISGYFSGPGGRKPDPALTALPELLGCVQAVRAKPRTSLAVHPTRQNEAGPLAVLAAQRFGAGRAVVFTADTTWQWFLPLQGLGADSPYHRFWGQTIRWLAGAETKARKAPSAAILRLDRTYLAIGESVKVLACVRQEQSANAAGASVSCLLTPRGGRSETLPMSPAGTAGQFELTYRPPRDGVYAVRLLARDAQGKEIGSDEMSLTVEKHSTEMDNTDRDDGLLTRLASRSQGACDDLTRLPEMIDRLVERSAALAPAAPQSRQYALYHFPVLFVLFVALLTVEWLLRRSWQLH